MSKSRTDDLPVLGAPDTVREKVDDLGDLVQRRYYGHDGRAVKDIDYGHDHTGVGDPHAHDWNWSKSPPRQSPRALTDGE